jgi:hypothetical protein
MGRLICCHLSETSAWCALQIDNERLVPDNWVANCVQAIAVAIVHCHTSADRLTIYLTTIH